MRILYFAPACTIYSSLAIMKCEPRGTIVVNFFFVYLVDNPTRIMTQEMRTFKFVSFTCFLFMKRIVWHSTKG